MREEAKRAESIVEGDDHRTLGREVLTVIPGEATGTAGEAAAVNPHHHRPLVAGGVRARPHVEVETVLAARWLAWRSGWCRWRRCRSCSTWCGAAPATFCATTTTATAAPRGTRRTRRTERVGL